MRTIRALAVAVTVVYAASFVLPLRAQGRQGAAAAAAACDRTCLTGLVDSYLAAMLAHDPSKVAIARTVKYTENTGLLDVGEGLWVGASEAPTTFRIYVPDPIAHQVGFFGVMKEFGKPVLLALRLRVENGQITEIEHVVARALNDSGLANLSTPRPGLLADVPAGQRAPRAQMLKIANSYYDSILKNSGKVAPFADDCVRHENGLQTTGTRRRQDAPPNAATISNAAALERISALGCADGIDTHALSYITGIDLRRINIADEQKGLVFGLTMFRHRGNVRTIKILKVPGVDTLPMDFGPIDLQAAHIFKVSAGTIHEIEAMGYTLPYKSNTGWETAAGRRAR
jgi:hypothetical protein